MNWCKEQEGPIDAVTIRYTIHALVIGTCFRIIKRKRFKREREREREKERDQVEKYAGRK